jgi:hypothetical protein
MKGSCLCGAVKFSVDQDLKNPDACHCSKCRKWTGHYLASADVPKSALHIEGEDQLSWYKSSEKVQRGFCKHCGSSLFFEPFFHDWVGVAMGALDEPSRTKLGMHIFVAEKGDYYDIADGLPQNEY